jgi:signal transduction histidine kinase/ABC-type branched-subunit amino acid transport system substrate-binding protein/CheY-like chemotaxis protein
LVFAAMAPRASRRACGVALALVLAATAALVFAPAAAAAERTPATIAVIQVSGLSTPRVVAGVRAAIAELSDRPESAFPFNVSVVAIPSAPVLGNLSDAVSAAVAQPNLVGVIGAGSMLFAQWIQGLLHPRALVPHMLLNAAAPVLTGRSVYPSAYRTGSSITLSAEALVQFCLSRGWRAVGVVYASREIGLLLMQEVTNYARRYGVRVVAVSAFMGGSNSSMEDAFRFIQNSRVKVTIIYANRTEAPQLMEKARSLGMVGRGYVWLFTLLFFESSVYSQEALRTLSCVLGTQNLPDTTSPEYALAESYFRPLSNDSFDSAAVEAYESAKALLLALNATGPSFAANNFEALRANLDNITFQTPSGLLAFAPNGDRLRNVDVMQVQMADGVFAGVRVAHFVPGTGIVDDAPLSFIDRDGFTPIVPPAFDPDSCPSTFEFRTENTTCDPCGSSRYNPRDDGVEECKFCPLGSKLDPARTGDAVCIPCGEGFVGAMVSGFPDCVTNSRSVVPLIEILAIVFALLGALLLIWFGVWARGLLLSERAAKSQLQCHAAFLAYVVHELRNPINGLIGFLELSLDKVGYEANKRGRASCAAALAASRDLQQPTPCARDSGSSASSGGPPQLAAAIDDARSSASAAGSAPSVPPPSLPPPQQQRSSLVDLLLDARSSAERILHVQTQVLLLAKLAEGALAPKPVPTDLVSLLQGLVERARANMPAEEKGVDIVLERRLLQRPGPLWVRLDTDIAERVFECLLTNAVKHTKRGCVTLLVSELSDGPEASAVPSAAQPDAEVSVSVAPVDAAQQRDLTSAEERQGRSGNALLRTPESPFAKQPSSADPRSRTQGGARGQATALRLRFAVRDLGPGIDKGARSLLMQSFSKLEIKPGVGLGLMLASRLVGVLGGKLRVRSPWSREHSGAEFWFELPLLKEDNPVPLPSSPSPSSHTPPLVPLAPLAVPATPLRDAVAPRVRARDSPLDELKSPLPPLQLRPPAGLRPLPALGESEVAGDLEMAAVPSISPARGPAAIEDKSADDAAPASPARSSVAADAADLRLEDVARNWQVLVVDDMPMNVKVAKKKLTEMEPFASLGWNVSGAKNGEEAFRLIAEEGKRFDLILMDQIMSGSGGKWLGTETLCHIRNLERQRGLPRSVVVGYTAVGEETKMEFDFRWSKPLPTVPDMARDILSFLRTLRR